MANTQPAAAFDTQKTARRPGDKIGSLPTGAELHRALWIRTEVVVGTIIAAA